MMSENKKHVHGEFVKGITSGITLSVLGVVMAWMGSIGINHDVEYKVATRDAYLSSTLSQQGFAMAFNGKPLNNVSAIEYTIVNRTGKQIGNAELIFKIEDKNIPTLVSAGIVAPNGIATSELIEEIPSKNLAVRKYKIKVLPVSAEDGFRAVFVFNEEKAPSMSIASGQGDLTLIPYKAWRDITWAIFWVILFYAVLFFLMRIYEYIKEPIQHAKKIEAFIEFAEEYYIKNKLIIENDEEIGKLLTAYTEYMKPKPSKFFGWLLPNRSFKY
jgi:hypothetical protein